MRAELSWNGTGWHGMAWERGREGGRRVVCKVR